VDCRSSARIDRNPRALPATPIEAGSGQATRGRHAAHLGVGGDADTAITPGAAQALLLLSPAGIVERSDGLIETALIIPAVIDHRPAAVRAVGKLGLRHEIDPPHFDRVEIEMAGNRLNGA